MSFGEDDVAAFLGDPAILGRARAYFRQGRVHSVASSPTQIDGEIEGSGAGRYRAVVALVNGKLHGACSCPYPLRCKHLGALLLAAIRSDVIPQGWDKADPGSEFDSFPGSGSGLTGEAGPGPDPSPGSGRDSGQDSGAGRPTPLGHRDLTQDKQHHRYWWSLDHGIEEYHTRLLPPGEEPQPGSRVLHLTIVADPIYSTVPGARLSVTPLVRYIRKDGTPGALSPWRPNVECVARTAGEIDYLPELNQREGRKIPLSRLLPGRVLDGQNIPIHVVRPRADTRSSGELSEVEFSRIAGLHLSFFPVRYTGEEVLFEPYLVIETSAGKRCPLNGMLEGGLRRWIEDGGRRFLVERRIDLLKAYLGRRGGYRMEENHYWLGAEEEVALLVDRAEGRVFWTTKRIHRRLLRELDPEQPRELSYPDIFKLKEHIQRSGGSDSIEVILPPGEAEIHELSAELVIEIRDGAVTLVRDLPFPDRKDVADGDHLVLEFYDNDRADTEIRHLAERCRELLTPLGPRQSVNGRLLCDGSIAEIVELIAGPMVEAGARVEVAGRPVRTGELSFALRVVSSGEDWFALRLTATVDGESVEAAGDGSLVYAADGSVIVARNPEELARLKKQLGLSADGTLRLQEGEFDRLGELEELFGASLSESVEEPAAEMIRRARERREAWLRLAGALETLDRGEPAGFGTTLRPYQRRGFAWLDAATAEGFGALLADDMGLGKTVQALALIQANVTERADAAAGEVAPRRAPLSLVVAPPATLENWRHEILTFAPALTPVVYHGSTRGALLQDSALDGDGRTAPGAPVLITSYQTLLKDAKSLSEVEWDHLIFDEVQQIKNAKTKSYRAARTLKSRRRIALSGTPVENSSLELYAVMDLLNPGILGSRAAFVRRFGTPIERDGDQNARRLLRELLTPLMLRRRKADVAKDLPSRDEIPVYVALPPNQRAVYERLRADYQERVRNALAEGQPGKRLFLILEGLTRLRQAAVDLRLLPAKLNPAAGSRGHRAEESGKLAALEQLVPDILAGDHRILIFSQFVSLLTILREWAQVAGYDYCYLDGSMSPGRRREEINRFQNKSGPPLFLISLRAGGVGINLTAADYVILVDPWWNPAVEDQAIDRTHRIGQAQPVTAYRLVASDTVEERIAALQARKKALARDIVPDESAMLSSLSPEEILDLFAPPPAG
ncbi:MAG: SNF2-related protein [Spirochaetaceae bacterium]